MSKQTGAAMVQVTLDKQEQPRPKIKMQRSLPMRCIREEHYVLLSAAGY